MLNHGEIEANFFENISDSSTSNQEIENPEPRKRRGYAYNKLQLEFQSALESLQLAPEQSNSIRLKKTPDNVSGDYGFPCQGFAKEFRKNPTQIAQVFAHILNTSLKPNSIISRYEAVGTYVNIHINYEIYGSEVVSQVKELGPTYGSENIGNGAHVVIDFSSPNIAKRMSVAHLRSTVIGYALSEIYTFLGYRVTRDNHLGDWGTNFGSIMYGIKTWGNMEKIQANPIRELQKLYTKTYKAGKEDPSIKTAASEWFLKLEHGDQEARQLWKQIVDWSLIEFQRVYDMMGIKFDLVLGESHYVEMIPDVMEELDNRGMLERSRGALVIKTDDKRNKNFMVQKSDGGSLYATRDLATAFYRFSQLQAEEVIYVVGAEQKEYFEELFKVLEMMGLPIADKLKHVYFGLYIRPGGKMSTRRGRVIYLEAAIKEAIKRTRLLVKERKVGKVKGKEKNELIKTVALGAIKWNDMMRNPRTSTIFDMDKALNVEGKSAPYVQYTHARAESILAGSDPNEATTAISPSDPLEKDLVDSLATFPSAIELAGSEHDPSHIVNALYDLAQTYNALYKKLPILKEENQTARGTRIALTDCTAQTIRNGLKLLGIGAPTRM